jgi:CheY-like chemotaxis protein
MSKLLVVDDDETVRESLREMLVSLKFDIVEAADGVEALLVYQAFRSEIQLVIMDIVMPRMDGIAATKAIKETNPYAKVILISAYSDKIPSSARPSAFLLKPFSRKDLCDIVQLVLKSVA